jgi:hypothetical protein
VDRCVTRIDVNAEADVDLGTIAIIVIIVLVVLFVVGYFGRGRLSS